MYNHKVSWIRGGFLFSVKNIVKSGETFLFLREVNCDQTGETILHLGQNTNE